jgi:dihydroorotate dehydrogenase
MTTSGNENAKMLSGMSSMMAKQVDMMQTLAVPQPAIPAANVAKKKIHPDHKATIAKCAKDVEKNMIKYTKLSQKITTAKAHLALYEQNMYPPNVKELHLSLEHLDLDEPLTDAIDSNYTIPVEIPRGSTRREASCIIHLSLHKWLKKVDVEAMESLRG